MMLSRVADRVYWMARYLERTENTARLVSVHTSLLMDLPERIEIDWYTLVTIFNAETLYQQCATQIDEAQVMQFMVAERENPSSIMTSFGSLRENVRTSLDFLPEEVWEQVNQTYMQLQAALPSLSSRHRRQALLRSVMSGCQRIRGALDSHMSRDHTFDFMQVGKHIERADMTSRTLEMTALLLSDARSEALRRYEGILWANLLAALGARQMYLRHQSPRIHGGDVLEFLVCNRDFPRSLVYSLNDVDHYLARLPDAHPIRALSADLLEQFSTQDVAQIPVDQIAVFMDNLQAKLTVLHNEIAKQWFYPEIDFSQYRSQTQSQSQSQGPFGQAQSQKSWAR